MLQQQVGCLCLRARVSSSHCPVLFMPFWRTVYKPVWVRFARNRQILFCNNTVSPPRTHAPLSSMYFCCVLLCFVLFCCVLLCFAVFCCVLLCLFCFVLFSLLLRSFPLCFLIFLYSLFFLSCLCSKVFRVFKRHLRCGG